MEHFLDVRGSVAIPVGADDQVVAGFGAGGASADIAVIVGVGVGELDGVVAGLRDRGDGDDGGFGTEIHFGQGVGGVAVGSDDGGVLGGEDAMFVLESANGSGEVRGGGVDEEFVCRGVVHDEGQAEDQAVLGDVFGFVERRNGNSVDGVLLLRLADGVIFVAAGREEQGKRTERGGALQECDVFHVESLLRNDGRGREHITERWKQGIVFL